MSNGFFQVGFTPGGTILKLFRATDGDTEISAKEISDFLSSKHILCNASAISQGIAAMLSSGKPDHMVLINKDYLSEIEESYTLRATSDKMSLIARFYPPSMKGRRLNADEFINDLTVKGVKFGIDEDAIRAFFAKPVYCTDVVVAKGREVVQGKHAFVEYFFETDLSQKPTLKEDGSVDFFALNTFTQCKKGDILARLHKEVQGENGMTIFGEPVLPLAVKRKALKYGRNLVCSEDGLVLSAGVDGQVSLVDEKVFLTDVMELDNVGPSTGNIDFEGNIRVLGNVSENFSIKAGGNVEVRGVVEGASIEAGGSITIARGMKGMGKGVLYAENNIIAKFFENAEVHSKGYVETESILHSQVFAGTEVIVTGKHGFITGGRVVATNLVRAKTIGTDMGANTVIEVGADPKIKARYQELQKNIANTGKMIETARPQIENFMKKMKSGATFSLDQKMYFQTMLTEDKKRKADMQAWTEELDSMQDILESTTEALVEVTGDIFVGAKIVISDASMIVKNTMTYCRFKKVNGEVRMSAL